MMDIFSLEAAYLAFVFLFVVLPVHELGHYAMMWSYGLKPRFKMQWNFGLFFAPSVQSDLLPRCGWFEESVTLWGGILAGLAMIFFLDGSGFLPAYAQTAFYVGYALACCSDISGFMNALGVRERYGSTPFYMVYGVIYYDNIARLGLDEKEEREKLRALQNRSHL